MARIGTPYWAERTPRRPSYPAFRGEREADAVVIGGGLTGATAAFVLASAGLDVVLLEADRLAADGTARSFGAILPAPDATFRAVESAAGRRVARAAWKEARRSALDLAAMLRRAGVKADLDETTLTINARTPDAAASLKKEQAARKAAGVDAPLLSARAAGAALGTSSTGAVRLRDAFLFDPVRGALGLAAAAARKGAKIFERSAVRRTRFTRKYADVITANGAIRTPLVFVATGGPGALFPALRRHVRAERGYVVATAQMPAAVRRDVGPRDSVVTEFDDGRRWLRWLPDDRAIFAGGVSPVPSARQREGLVLPRTAELMYELSVRHPAISGLPAEWAWDVPVVSTADGLPWIGPHRNYPFHFFAFAFGWHGDGLAAFAAKAALRFARGERPREDDSFGFLR